MCVQWPSSVHAPRLLEPADKLLFTLPNVTYTRGCQLNDIDPHATVLTPPHMLGQPSCTVSPLLSIALVLLAHKFLHAFASLIFHTFAFQTLPMTSPLSSFRALHVLIPRTGALLRPQPKPQAPLRSLEVIPIHLNPKHRFSPPPWDTLSQRLSQDPRMLARHAPYRSCCRRSSTLLRRVVPARKLTAAAEAAAAAAYSICRSWSGCGTILQVG